MSKTEFDKADFIKFINQGAKCKKDCISHKLYTHNVCITCSALKNSPYHQDFLKDKTDDKIAEAVKEAIEEFGE